MAVSLLLSLLPLLSLTFRHWFFKVIFTCCCICYVITYCCCCGCCHWGCVLVRCWANFQNSLAATWHRRSKSLKVYRRDGTRLSKKTRASAVFINNDICFLSRDQRLRWRSHAATRDAERSWLDGSTKCQTMVVLHLVVTADGLGLGDRRYMHRVSLSVSWAELQVC